MKTTHIIGIVVIAIAIGLIVTTAGDASQYVTFDTAFEMAEKGDNSKIHVIGELTKDADNEVIGVQYNPLKDPNYLSFRLVDDNKEEHEVVCYNPPASMRDFEHSEKVVIIGNVQKGKFVASQILMKCPSKYEDKEIQVNGGNSVSKL